MVKIINQLGDVKVGKQGNAVYQRHYGRQIRRTLKPKPVAPSKLQQRQRDRFREALLWRATLTLDARRYLEAYSISNRVVDVYGIPLTWDKFALKIALETPVVAILG